MTLIGGLSGLSTAATLIRTLREGLKSGEMKQDEVAGRIGEIYDYIVDSKDALVDAKEEIERLKSELREIHRNADISSHLKFDGSVYWRIDGGDIVSGPYCSGCWDNNRKLVNLQRYETDSFGQIGKRTRYKCSVHNDLTFYSSTMVPERNF